MGTSEALALLLSDPAWRKRFTEAPLAVACELCGEADARLLAGIDAGELAIQAAALIKKRIREVFPLVPASSRGRQDEFMAYGESCWPDGHHRHHLDALGFLGYLRARGYRICLREIARLQRSGRILFDIGFVHTSRGWRPGLLLAVPGRFRWLLTLG